jgi:hypothetical protein
MTGSDRTVFCIEHWHATRCWRPLGDSWMLAVFFPHLSPGGKKQVIWHFPESLIFFLQSGCVVSPILVWHPFLNISKCAINVGEPLRKSNVRGLWSAEYSYLPEARTPRVINHHLLLINPGFILKHLVFRHFDNSGVREL